MNTLRYGLYSHEGQPEDKVVLYPNDIAGGLDDYHGERAEVISRLLGMPVLAYERALSSEYTQARFDLGLRSSIARNPAEFHARTASAIARIIQRLTPSAELIALGHSAGASEAIGLTATEILPVTDLVATDPAGIRHSFPVYAELVEYGLYQISGESEKPDTQLTFDFKCKPDGSKIAKRVIYNIAMYSRYWRGDSTCNALAHIATDQTETAASVVFPSHTFTARPKTLEKIANTLTVLRPTDVSASFTVKVDPETYHSTYDNPEVLAGIVSEHLSSQQIA